MKRPMILITPSDDKKKYRLANNIDFYGTFIPEGFEFDGASVPRFFWRIVSPFQPWVIRAACGHDYLNENAIGTKKNADKKFMCALKRDGAPKWLVPLMYRSVRWFGKGNFKE